MSTFRKQFLTVACLSVVVMLGACTSSEDRQKAYFDRAQAHLDEGNLDKARIDAKNVLQINPHHGPSFFLLAQVNEQEGDARAYMRNLRKAIDNDPGLVDAQVRMGQIFLAGRRLDEAQTYADTALEYDPGNTSARSLAALILWANDEREAAVEAADAILAEDPANVGALSIVAGARGEQQPEEVLAMINAALEISPDELQLINLKAGLLKSLGRTDEVVDTLWYLIEQNPDQPAHYQRLLQYLSAQGMAIEPALERMIDPRPESRDVNLWLTGFLSGQPTLDISEPALQAYVDAEPEVLEYKLALARLALVQSRAEDGIALYEEVIAADPRGVYGQDARNAILNVLFYISNDRDAAEEVLAEILEIEPNNSEALVTSARIKLEDGDTQGAITALRTVVRDDPQEVSARLILAEAYQLADSEDLALDTYRSVLEISPGNPVASLKVAEILLRKGDRVTAESMLQNMIDQGPVPPRTYELLVETRMRNQQWDDARAVAQPLTASESAAEAALGHFLLGKISIAADEVDRGTEELRKGLALNPTSNEAIGLLVSALIQQDRAEDAEAFLVAHREANPEQATVSDILGNFYLARGSIDEATAAYRAAIEVDPQRAESYALLAQALVVSGDRDAALTSLAEGLAAVPGSLPLLLLQADLLQVAGRFDEAATAYDEALSIDASNLLAANNLAMILVDQRGDNASIRRALELSADFDLTDTATLLDTRGWVLLRAGQTMDAIRVLTRASQMEGWQPVFSYHLGMAFLESGDRVGAKRELTRALDGDNAFTGRDEAEKVLAELQ